MNRNSVLVLIVAVIFVSAALCLDRSSAGSIEVDGSSIAGVPTPTPAPLCSLNESFDSGLPADWFAVNLSQPVGPGGWSLGDTTAFLPASGSGFIGVGRDATGQNGTISAWLMSPVLDLHNGAAFFFETRTRTNVTRPDRLVVLLSKNGNSTNVSDFNTLIWDINPNYTLTGYPNTWFLYGTFLSGIPVPTSGRIAFLYFVQNGGAGGPNSDYIGVDNLSYGANCPDPSPTPTPTPTPSPAPPSLGVYPATNVSLGANTTIVPNVVPTGATRIQVSTSTGFLGGLTADPATGIVRVTNAHHAHLPAGPYTVTVAAFGPGGTATTTFTLTVTATPCMGISGFTPPAGPQVQAHRPYSVAIGDFNRDGNQDLVSADNDFDSVWIELGNGSGGFTYASQIIVGVFPTSVAVGDLNGDGKQDFVTANAESDTVSIRLGDGTGGFTSPPVPQVPVGDYPYSVALGDFNGDGNQDIAAANDLSHNVSIRLGDGTGGFTLPAVPEIAAGVFPESIAIGDINGDGDQDFVVASYGPASVSIQLGNGNGGFTALPAVGVGNPPRSVALGDVNGDGHPDLVTASDLSDTASIRLGNGSGGFTSPPVPEVAVGNDPFSVALGDFNGDGNQDFVTANLLADTVSIRWGNGSGGFTLPAVPELAVGSGPISVAVCELNGDGRQDLAVGNNGSFSIRLGSCTSATPTPTLSPTPTPTPIPTPTPTPAPSCIPAYAISDGFLLLTSAGLDIDNHCDDCTTTINLGFYVWLYGQQFSHITVDSNGRAFFQGGTAAASNTCLPHAADTYAIYPYWDDLRTDTLGACGQYSGGQCGIFRDVSGITGNRRVYIEWRGVYAANPAMQAHFEIILYERDDRFDVIYDTVDLGNTSATAGVQKDESNFTPYFCNGNGGPASGAHFYTLACAVPTPTPAPTPTPSPTPTPTPSPSPAVQHVAFDFDGDRKADISIWRPSLGQWWLDRSTAGTLGISFGDPNDIPRAADYTGDGKTDVAFFRPSDSSWFVLRSEDFTYFAFPFGASGDIPAPADFDGDGEADPTVYRPSAQTWFIVRSTGGVLSVPFGLPNDIPVPADYDGDGKADVGIYRPDLGQWWYLRSSNGSVYAAPFGSPGDKPVPGDYTGDGKADVAFYRPSEGSWYVLRSEDSTYYAFPFGNSTDKPAPADFDGDGKFDAAVFRPSDTNWYILKSTGGIQIQQFGAANDIPLPGAFVP